MQFELGAHGTIGPDDPHHVGAGLIAQAEMKLRAVDGLLLQQQARANFYFAADAEWIDALVSRCLSGSRPYHLPVIIL